MSLRVATVAWKLRPVRGDSSYFGHFYDLVSAAHDEGAQVVVFPELHVLELLPLAKKLEPKDAAKYLVQYSEAVEGWISRIADSSGMILIGGSHFRKDTVGIKNVCAVGVPGKGVILNEKNNLTPYERKSWRLSRGEGLAKLPKNLGVTICYDSQFPEASRALASAGMLVQCVPSWTETQQAFNRVRWSCLSRSLENQIYVIHSALVGTLGLEPVPSTWGSSAIIAPPMSPFPYDGILRETNLNEEGVLIAELDFELLRQVRRGGESTCWEDQQTSHWKIVGKPADSGPGQTHADRRTDLN